MSNFHEACDICTFYIVDVAVRLCTVFNALLVDIMHDLM